jgi:hypothetical protein
MPTRQQVLFAFVALLVIAAIAVAALRPALRQPLGLISAGLALAWIRHRYFRVPGVHAVPFSRATRLFAGRPRKAKAH